MTTLYALMHNDWWLFFVGCCALAVIFALLKSINSQPGLPEPSEAAKVKEPLYRARHDAYEVSGGRVRHV